MEKMYWFSPNKHGMDIEFRYNRVRNTMSEMVSGMGDWEHKKPTKEDYDLYEKLEKLADRLDEIRDLMFRNGCCPIKLTAKLYSLAMETVMWASEARGSGKSKYGV